VSQGFAREARIGVDLHVGETLYFTSNDTFEKADYPGLYGVRVRACGGGGAGGGANTTGAGQAAVGGGGGGGGYAESVILASALASSETVTVGAGGVFGVSAAGHSSFGSHVQGNGGGVGSTSSAITTSNIGANPGSGGGGAGDLVVAGGSGFSGPGGDGADGIVIVEVLYERKIAVDEDIHPQYLGTYGEALILVDDLGTSETVTVGGGGAGGVGNSAGSSGDASSFGSHVSAPGGLNGASGSAPGTSFVTNSSRVPPGGATGTAADILSVPGGTTSGHFRASATQGLSSAGGSSVLGVGGRALGADDDGEPGEGYGGGGSGAAARSNSGNQTGGAGSDGIVIVELYY
jgi:hypothetical protein